MKKIKKNNKKNKVAVNEFFKSIQNSIRRIKENRKITFKEFGIVLSIQDGVAIATGLRNVGLTEVVKFQRGINGMVATLEKDITRICLMGPDTKVKPGDIIHRMKTFIEVPTGHALLGRIVDSLGNTIDGNGPLIIKQEKKINKKRTKVPKILMKKKILAVLAGKKKSKTISAAILRAAKIRKAMQNKDYREHIKTLLRLTAKRNMRIERPAPGIMDRESISEPVHTGTKVIDALIPVGRGQRELILGDRNTGKTTIAIDTILSQVEHNRKNPFDKIVSVYVAVGQRQSKVQEVVNLLHKRNALKDTCIVFAPSYAPVLLQFIAPYSGTTMAEYFRDKGRHALVIYYDLTKHAQLHRQMSLLLKVPPGREAYPGDVFYVHARLLERSAKLSKKT